MKSHELTPVLGLRAHVHVCLCIVYVESHADVHVAVVAEIPDNVPQRYTDHVQALAVCASDKLT